MIADQTRRIHKAAPARIQIFLSENQLYRAIIVAERARMKIVQKSGIHSKTRNTIALILANCTRNFCVSMIAFFLLIQYAIKNIYPILKNSEGCMFGSQGKFTRPLAVLYFPATQGTKTKS